MDDLEHVAAWFWNFEDIALFDRNLPVPVNHEMLRESWRSALSFADPPRAFWFVAQDADARPAAIGGLQAINYIHGDAVLPMFVADHVRRCGVGTAVTASLMDLAFRTLRLHRLTTFFRQDNEASEHTLRGVGWQMEGRLREAWYADGMRRDLLQAGVLASDWAAVRDDVLARLGGPGKVRLSFQGENNIYA